jgi:glycosyltransferase involved in cell wall biosynthesis
MLGVMLHELVKRRFDMRVRVDVSPAVQERAGVGRYAEEVTLALTRICDEHDIGVFYTDNKGRTPVGPLGTLSSDHVSWSNFQWRMQGLLSQISHQGMDAAVGRPDLFHATDHLLPYLTDAASVFTLHDLSYLACPEVHTRNNRWFLQLAVPRFLQAADEIICISEFTKREAQRIYGLEESRITVIPQGVDSGFRPIEDRDQLAAVRKTYGLPEHFLLYVGTIEPRKNLMTLAEAYAALRREGRTEKLVIVGRQGWLHSPFYRRLRELGIEEEVIFTGYVSKEGLPTLFCLADAFVFPSLYEGFGLPPLEAMACGTAVVCSNSSSLPEVCGDAALLIEPRNVVQLKEALTRVLDDQTLRRELRERGLRQVQRFSWENTARATCLVYKRALEHRERQLSIVR